MSPRHRRGAGRKPDVGSSVVRVLESYVRPRQTTNPYIVMLADALGRTPGLEPLEFSWRTALLSRYDVFHVHWPENLLRGTKGIKSLARRLLFGALLVKLSMRRTPVVRTVHNIAPHEQLTRSQSWLLRRLERRVRHYVVLAESEEDKLAADSTCIPHGHYQRWFAAQPVRSTVPGRLAFVGLVRRYKNVGGLVRAFREVEDPELSLHIAGNPSPAELGTELAESARTDLRISTAFRYLSDAELVEEVTSSEIVILPYTEMYNSGAVLMALSLNRPVLVPDNARTRALAEEVGEGWVIRFDGPLSPKHIIAALASVREQAHNRLPDLSARGWGEVGYQHGEVFRRVVGHREPDYSRREAVQVG